VHLESLSPASRKRFIQQQCEERTLRLHTEVVEWLTQRGPSLRELLGELNRLDTLARFSPPPLRLDVVLNQSPETESESKPEKLIHQVAAHFDVPIKQLKGKARHRNILWPRQVAIYLLREMLGLPLVRIGSFFGGRDHTTVMHAIEKVKAVLGEDAGTAQEIRKLRAVLQ
jgi:chromosomal replication initiator protein